MRTEIKKNVRNSELFGNLINEQQTGIRIFLPLTNMSNFMYFYIESKCDAGFLVNNQIAELNYQLSKCIRCTYITNALLLYRRHTSKNFT